VTGLTAIQQLNLGGHFAQESAVSLRDPRGLEIWPLFPTGEVPNERFGLEETHVAPNMKDLVGMFCAPGEKTGNWYYNVTIPGLLPMLVDKSNPLFKDAAVIIVPGGGHSFLAWTKEGVEIGEWLNSIGISTFVLKYEVPETTVNFTRSVLNLQRAMSLVREKAPEFGLNASRIGVIGFSAGGGVAVRGNSLLDKLYYKVDEADSQSHLPDFQLLVYGNSGQGGVPISPMPTFIAHTSTDICCPVKQALDYYQLMSKLAPTELHIFPDGGHGFGSCRSYPEKWYEACTWPDRAQMFLEQQVLHIPSQKSKR
ncbi:unnamed protein product, partial [Polarella glacialis]